MLSAEIVTVNYRIPLTPEQYDFLDPIDCSDSIAYYDDIVRPRLEAAGAESIDYNGHFGYVVFFTATSEDVGAVVRELDAILAEAGKKAKGKRRAKRLS